MAFINLSSVDKKARAGQISTSIGASGNMLIYTGSPPSSPDLTATGTLLVTLPLSATAGVAYTQVQSLVVVAPGSGGTAGAQTITGTTGTGTFFTAAVTVTAGAISAVNSISNAGQYSVNPTNVNVEPVTGGGLTGATVALTLTGELLFNAITTGTAVATGTAGYARIATSGGVGVVDLDVNTSGSSVIITSTAVVSGGSVSVTSAAFVEA